jgi:hypothetical protein
MIDAILHTLGLCGDAHSHIDLLDLLITGAFTHPTLIWIKECVKSVIK